MLPAQAVAWLNTEYVSGNLSNPNLSELGLIGLDTCLLVAQNTSLSERKNNVSNWKTEGVWGWQNAIAQVRARQIDLKSFR